MLPPIPPIFSFPTNQQLSQKFEEQSSNIYGNEVRIPLSSPTEMTRESRKITAQLNPLLSYLPQSSW
jgi:hypothetical protein